MKKNMQTKPATHLLVVNRRGPVDHMDQHVSLAHLQ